MAEKHTSIRGGLYKCLGCGQIITLPDERDTMLVINGTSVNVNLVGEKSAIKVHVFTGGLPNGLYLLHRCDSSHVCVCDFIGLEVKEDG